ncbi:MAG: glycosyltransferase [Desulfosporosinus sp.]|nr:glycosyltransferase [Desulfosporosinus sp.]
MFYYGSLQQGGAERVIASLANNFSQRGAVVSILLLDDKPSLHRLDERINYLNLCANAVSRNLTGAIINNLRRIGRTRTAFKTSRPDVVVCFGINNLVFAVLSKAFLGIKIIGSERSNPYRSGESSFWRKMKRIMSPQADGYIFSTEGAKGYYPVKTQKKSAVIPNGVFADTMPRRVPLLRERRQQTICSTGRLESGKGFDTLIKAFAIFHEILPDYTLHIYGEGTQQLQLEQLIAAKGLQNHAFLEGYATDVPAILCSHTMFAFTSRHEGMPNGLIEALACGLPCVVTNCDFGPADLINTGENGLLVPVDDEKAVAEAMKRIAFDQKLAEKLSRNALKIRETHSMEEISQRFYDYITSKVKES